MINKPANTLAFGVMDMGGECLHSVHIDQNHAEKASFGLGYVVPLVLPTMKVKRLEWVVDEDRMCLASYALGFIYRIVQLHPEGRIWLSINGVRTAVDTDEEAKEVAQRDFESKVTAVIECEE